MQDVTYFTSIYLPKSAFRLNNIIISLELRRFREWIAHNSVQNLIHLWLFRKFCRFEFVEYCTFDHHPLLFQMLWHLPLWKLMSLQTLRRSQNSRWPLESLNKNSYMPPINIYHMKIYLWTSRNNNKMKLDITSFLENSQYLSF